MKYALVLESDPKACNDTCTLLASRGYLITPVFSPKKALHAAHMIQFDLIVTSTTSVPGDRRSLTGEFARCSPQAKLILLADPEQGDGDGPVDGVSAIVCRPLTTFHLEALIGPGSDDCRAPLPPLRLEKERRKRAVD